MNLSPAVEVFTVVLGVASVVAGYLVFRTDSMVRATYWLLGSFVAVGVILLVLGARFLGLSLLLMMAGEMSVMVIFMVGFMMNPAGLNPMMMVHQHRTSIVAGVVSFLALATVGVVTQFPQRPAVQNEAQVTFELGVEELGNSMLVMQSAGAVLLATMIGTIAIASRRGRYGMADEGSEPPPLDPAERADAAAAPEPEEDEHAGHAMPGMGQH